LIASFQKHSGRICDFARGIISFQIAIIKAGCGKEEELSTVHRRNTLIIGLALPQVKSRASYCAKTDIPKSGALHLTPPARCAYCCVQRY